MDKFSKVSFDSFRRFGVEIELNSFDKRDFKELPLKPGELPEGIHYIATLITKITENIVEIKDYHHTDNNKTWILKPDSSCGIEICSPVLSGWSGLKTICEVIDVLGKDDKITSDKECSLHIHTSMSDLSMKEMATVLLYWIKTEHIFISSLPSYRKINDYCKFIGMTDRVTKESLIYPDNLVKLLGEYKYYSVNTYNFVKGRRQSMEFRLMENEGCIDPFKCKNWVRLILHFIEKTKNLTYLEYAGHFCWIELKDLFSILDFDKDVSLGMEQVRNWFLSRIIQNSGDDPIYSVTRNQAEELVDLYQIDVNKYLNLQDYDKLYDCNFMV